MKKILFSIALFAGFSANAQLANGSIAPDFTLTDINGKTHNLYTILSQGKTVFLDVSATWCGPCWNFHNTGALESLWVSHGPAGESGVSASTTDDVFVIFLEGDASTNSADLNGTGSNTQGNWVAGAQHPIIDPTGSAVSTFNNNYNIGYFPTIYRICQNRTITEVGQASAATLYAGVGSCPAPASNPSDVSFLASTGKTSICGPATYTPSVQIQNYGTTNLTDASVSISFNGSVVSTGTFSGNLATYELATITCTDIPNFTGGNLEFTVTTSGDADLANGVKTVNIIGAKETTSKILLSVKTDSYATETSWNIRKANNAVYSGTVDPLLANNTMYDFEYNLNALGCYTFNMTDSGDDGITGNGSVNVRDENNVIITNTKNFGSSVTIPFKVLSFSTSKPTVTASAPIDNGVITVCDGNSVTLTSSSATNNEWSTGSISKSITVTTAGTYTLTINGAVSDAIVVEFQSCAGIEENNLDALSIYPNPTKGNIVIDGKDLIKYSEIQVIDNTGRIVQISTINNTSMILNLESLEAGTYMLLFKGENNSFSKSIQITK